MRYQVTTRTLAVLVAILAVPTLAHAALDKYGGTTTLPCAGGASAHFRTQQIGARWVLCDPLGNAFILKGAIAADPGQTTYISNTVASKYGAGGNIYTLGAQGSIYNWVFNTITRLQLWGFNDSSDVSNVFMWPVTVAGGWNSADHTPPDPIKTPFNLGAHLTGYTLSNTQGCGMTSAMKETMGGVGSTYFNSGFANYNFPDFYDPGYPACVANIFLPANDPSGIAAALGVRSGFTTAHNDWLIYLTLDEGDTTGFLNAGPDFPTVDDSGALAGNPAANPAWIVLASSPAISKATNIRSVGSVTYSNSTNYSKLAFANSLVNEYVCTGAGAPLACCTAVHVGACSVNPAAGAGIAVTGANMTAATSALNTAWGSSFTTLSTSDATNCGSNLATCLTTPTYNAWGNGNCQAAGDPLACCTGNGTGTCGTHGTGLLDEDGSDQFMGDVCNLKRTVDPQHCLAGRTTAETTAMQADMSTFLTGYETKYFGTTVPALAAQVNTEVPGATILIQMKVGSFGAPARKEVLAAACQYLTLPQMEGAPPYSNPTISDVQARYDFVSANCGNHPWMLWEGDHANPDSGENGAVRGDNISSTQAGRSALYTSMVNACLTLADTVTGIHHCVGWYWWSYYDANGVNWGLVTETDNPYDGTATVAGDGNDANGYAILPEGVGSNPSTVPGNYGNFINAVKAANLGVYSVIGSGSPGGGSLNGGFN